MPESKQIISILNAHAHPFKFCRTCGRHSATLCPSLSSTRGRTLLSVAFCLEQLLHSASWPVEERGQRQRGLPDGDRDAL